MSHSVEVYTRLNQEVGHFQARFTTWHAVAGHTPTPPVAGRTPHPHTLATPHANTLQCSPTTCMSQLGACQWSRHSSPSEPRQPKLLCGCMAVQTGQGEGRFFCEQRPPLHACSTTPHLPPKPCLQACDHCGYPGDRVVCTTATFHPHTTHQGDHAPPRPDCHPLAGVCDQYRQAIGW
jgi:hypothetical protein